MTYLETQQNDAQAAREEARRLRTKMKTFQKYDVDFAWASNGTVLNFILFYNIYVFCLFDCPPSFREKSANTW